MERTFVMVKPDGVQRGLVGEIVRRFEQRGLRIVALKMVSVSQELARASTTRSTWASPFTKG